MGLHQKEPAVIINNLVLEYLLVKIKILIDIKR